MTTEFSKSLDSRLVLLVALLAGAATLMVLRAGVVFTPDSWAYWEASVSMLEGHGYRYFGGASAAVFPPTYSAYLALIQAILGTRGASLAVGLSLMAILYVWAWWWAAQSLGGGAWSRGVQGLFLLGLAGSTPMLYRSNLSECLALPLLGLVLATGFSAAREEVNARWLRLIGLVVVVFLLVWTRLVAAGWVLAWALALMIVESSNRKARRAALLSGASAILAALSWRAVAGAGRHHFDLTGVADLVPELVRGAMSWAVLLAKSWLGYLVLLLLVGATLSLAASRRGAPRDPPRRDLVLAHFVTANFVATSLLSTTFEIADPFSGRFLWPLLPSTLLLAASLARSQLRMLTKSLALAALSILALTQSYRALSLLQIAGAGQLGGHVRWEDRIDPSRYCGEAESSDHGRLLIPPDFPWLERCPSKAE